MSSGTVAAHDDEQRLEKDPQEGDLPTKMSAPKPAWWHWQPDGILGRSGLTISRASNGRGRPLAYGWKYGFGVGWLDHRIQRLIVAVWNRINCRIFGHDDILLSVVEAGELGLEDAHCVHCCQPLKVAKV